MRKPAGAIDWTKMTIEDLQANPHRFGLPTFEEFAKNRDKWFGRPDDQMVVLSDGPQSFRKDLKKIRYQVHGVELSGEDAVEKALGDHGYGLNDIDLTNKDSRLKKDIQMIPLGGGKYEIVVNFLP